MGVILILKIMKKIGVIYILVFVIFLAAPKFLYSQKTITFYAETVGHGSYKEIKEDPRKFEWYKFGGTIVIDYANNTIKIGRSTFRILKKHYIGSVIGFVCICNEDNEKYKITYDALEGVETLALLKGDVIRNYLGSKGTSKFR